MFKGSLVVPTYVPLLQFLQSYEFGRWDIHWRPFLYLNIPIHVFPYHMIHQSHSWAPIWKKMYFKVIHAGVPVMALRLMNLTSIHEDIGSIPGLLIELRILHCHELWC